MTNTDETLIAYGGAVKALGDGRIGGYLVAFTGPDAPDLQGEFFDAATDFDADDGDPVTLYYNHGLDPTLKRRKLGKGAIKRDDAGIWLEAQLALRDEYERLIYGLAEAGKLGWSSGSLPHLVEREPMGKATRITAWPLGKDASLTPTPAAGPTLTAITTLKSWAANLRPLEVANEGAGKAPETTAKAVAQSEQTPLTFGEIIMTTEPTPVGREEFDALKGDIGSMSARLDQLLSAMTDSAPLKRAGYLAPDSENDHPEVKSFGDFLIAVKRNNIKRLAGVYGAIKDMAEGEGPRGGYLVPVDYATTLMRVTAEDNPVLSRVRRVPVAVESGRYPALDMYTAPTAGAGNVPAAGGLTAANTAEGTALTETQPKFESIQWNVNKIGGYVEVTNELIADSPVSIEALLGDLFRIAINAKLERHVLRGSGTGEPLGILNSSVAVGVTTAGDNVFAEADALSMLARFKPVGGTQPVWIMHRSVLPDLGAFSDTTSALINWNSGVSQALLGYPIVYSEHMPQANGDDVLLADLGAYLLFERQGLVIGYSEHAAFTSDMGTWRFTYRCDGKPWMRSAITLADPTGSYTVSPFVFHDD